MRAAGLVRLEDLVRLAQAGGGDGGPQFGQLLGIEGGAVARQGVVGVERQGEGHGGAFPGARTGRAG